MTGNGGSKGGTTDDADLQRSAQETNLATEIRRVVIYRDGARVFRTTTVELEKGHRRLCVAGLTERLLRDSVRVSGRGRGALGAIDVDERYHTEVSHEQLQALRQRENELGKKLELVQERQEFAEGRREHLRALSERFAAEFPAWLSSGEAGLSTLSEFLQFESDQNTENLEQRRQLADEAEETTKELEAVRAEISAFQGPDRVHRTVEVTVAVDAEAAGPFELELSYQVGGVSWTPSYDVDLRADSAHIRGFAEVVNRTLENWTDVAMQVSTAVFRPVSIAEPAPFFVDIDRPVLRSEISAAFRDVNLKAGKAASAPAPSEAEGAPADEEVWEQQEASELAAPEARMQESPAGVQSFEVPGTWTIPSDGSGHPVTLSTFELPSKKRFYWCASDSPSVIAVDEIENGEGVLLAGRAKVYAEGDFIGETRIDQVAPGETFDLGAREELRIRAEKKLLERAAEKAGLMKGRRSVVYAYSLELKSFRDAKAEITVKDVIPHSKSEKIRVRWIECNRQQQNEELGVYTWKLTLEPGAETAIRYRYGVDWERDETVTPPLP